MANIELWAIDLSWDIISRFVPHFRLNDEPLPKEFTDDFVRVALEETKHFNLLKTRLGEMGSHFGSLPVHNGKICIVNEMYTTFRNLLIQPKMSNSRTVICRRAALDVYDSSLTESALSEFRVK